MDTSELLERYAKGDRVFRNIYLRGAAPDFKGANLSGIDLQGSTLHEVNLEGANLKGANLQETTLEYVNLQKANLQETNFRESNLQKTTLLEGANLRKANLVYAQLQRVNLQEADLREANLSAANIRGANLQRANLQGADLTATNIEQTDLQGITYSNTTKWPSIKVLNQAIFSRGVISNLQIVPRTDTGTSLVVVNNYTTSVTFEQAKEKIKKSIGQRQGQSKFRRCLLTAYKSCCAITGCEVEEALEAAHIIPYCLTRDNDPSNGLLLRADLHTLFDLNMIIIDPETRTVYLNDRLRGCDTYRELLEKTILRQPMQINDGYWRKALQWRRYEYKQFLD